MSAIILQNEIVHYEVLGRGRPVIFLHGWVGSWRYWIPAMQAASNQYRAYAIDLFGFGDSAKTPLHYSLDGQVALLSAFLEQLGIGKIALVGHGLGAALAAMFTSRFPQVVDRLMLVSSPNGGVTVNARLRSEAPPALVEWLLGRNSEAEPVRVEAPKADPQALATSLAELDSPHFAEITRQLTRPTVLVYGQSDQAVALKDLDNPLPDLPETAHLVIFESSGHFPMLDEPSKFNRLIGEWLALASGESPRSLQVKEEWKRRVR